MNQPVTSVLIANRGEIAARIARGAREMGIRTVGVYADSDFLAGFLDLVDEAYALHGDTPAETYLDADKLIAIAHRAGANAVHPGYGFLSENAEFAQRVVDEGLVWIGPSAAVIDTLGNKVSAREAAAAADTPLLPSTPGYLTGPEEARAFGAEQGYPIAIKAAFGGGGRGLRVVWSAAEVAEQLRSAQDEARTAFGRDECFAEVFLHRPRHIETQVAADAHGNVVVIGTRDCSLQRRNQKVIEESPAPNLDPELEQRLVEGSRRLFREVGYVGVGTVEFLVSADGRATFLEVNTRLQVEHSATEEAYGVDLVQEQFRIARGEQLSFTVDPRPIGHAIEFRINAEDPLAGFLPFPGRVTSWIEPAGPGVRMDSGARQGTQIAGAFDSLLAKLIVSGANRKEALARSRSALRQFTVTGIPTLLPFHRAIVEDPAFAEADGVGGEFGVYTTWIEEEWQVPDPPLIADYGELAAPEPVAFETQILEIDGKRSAVRVPVAASSRAAKGRSGHLTRPRPQRRSTAAEAVGDGALTAPMRSEVVRVDVASQDSVAEGEVLFVLEAMKMELTVRAPFDGIVTDLTAEAGSSVSAGTLLAVITPHSS